MGTQHAQVMVLNSPLHRHNYYILSFVILNKRTNKCISRHPYILFATVYIFTTLQLHPTDTTGSDSLFLTQLRSCVYTPQPVIIMLSLGHC